MIHEGSLPDLLRQLQDREVDLILTQQAGPAGDGDSFRKTLVGRLPIFFCASPELARRCKAFPRDLAELPLLLPPPNHPLRHDIDRYLASLKKSPQVVGEIADAEFMRVLAVDGAGVAPFHTLAVSADLRAGRLLRLGSRSTGIFKTIWLMARAGPLMSGSAQHLFERFRFL
jgi:LysR family transcriptional activator of nhaA